MKLRKYWRSLDELSDTPEFQRWLHAEFPEGVSETASEMHRRDFLRLMGGSIALAGLGACTKQPIEKIVPYVKEPEEVIPGKPLRFASATTFNGYAQGIVVTSHEGRPTKIEGNPDHPASLGATTSWAQADLLDLYDPDRAQAVMRGENISTLNHFLQDLDLALAGQQSRGGAGIRILTEPTTSPTLAAQLQAIEEKFPKAKWHQSQPTSHDSLEGGVDTIYDFSKAKVVVALDSDFLYMHPAALRHARDFAATRRMTDSGRAAMSRLYVAEPTPTITGSNADHRIPVAARHIKAVVEEIAARVGAIRPIELVPHEKYFERWMQAVVKDLLDHPGASVVLAGEGQLHAQSLIEKINHALGNVGGPVLQRRSVEQADALSRRRTLQELVHEMQNGAVELLIILGGNPVYDAPIDFDFANALLKVKLSAHHTLCANETSRRCHWLIPATHFLESWSDARASDESISIVQPLIEPLYAGISVHEMIAALLERPVRSAYEIVHEHWQSRNPTPQFETDWRRALSDGIFHGGDLVIEPAPLVISELESWPPSRGGLEILFRPDPNILDGRYANNGWLQELPRPLSKLTWDNAALVSPILAQREKLQNGDVVELNFRGRKLNAPVWVQPGQAEDSVTVHLGYGRTVAGRIGNNVGFNAYVLRTSDARWHGDGLTLRKTGAKHQFATTQHHFSIEGRDILRTGTLAEFVAKGELPHEPEPAPNETLLDPNEFANNGYAWAMVIDLNTCIGCNACTIACQAENNIPVVGKDQVARGREMHWIRIDTYHAGSPNEPEFNHQPVPCMHCEHAPCELVCPVGATVHDDEGLNLQVYNRCVGTRYCSNNCPYKVRRFNFFELNGDLSPTEKLVKNPDVTVRSRGVMEKCTYCLQRINAARYAAELDNDRRIRDGEVVPACAQVCPTEAIVFGDVHDPNSRVSQLKRSPLNYSMLAELNTRPRTSYLAKLRNPRPEVT
jgi:MoCo/4Fe-4S cofactor protein with predicted Tat translocation signal